MRLMKQLKWKMTSLYQGEKLDGVRKRKRNSSSNKLGAELGKINDELASYACIKERAELSNDYKERVETLTSKNMEVEKKIKRKLEDIESQQRLREKKKKALEKLQLDHPEVRIVSFWGLFTYFVIKSGWWKFKPHFKVLRI